MIWADFLLEAFLEGQVERAGMRREVGAQCSRWGWGSKLSSGVGVGVWAMASLGLDKPLRLDWLRVG